jgi:glycosyltransferase involved in cell wall biosynthesis
VTVVLVADPAQEPTGYPVVPRFLRLLERGWDPHLVLMGAGSARIERGLPPETRGRVHGIASPARRTGRPASWGGLARARRAGSDRQEARTLRSLVNSVDAELVHLPSAAIADRWLRSTDGLSGRVVLSLCGGDLDADVLAADNGHSILWERAAALCVESVGMAEVAARHGAPSGRTRVVPPVPDAEPGRADPRADDADGSFRILGIGPLSWTHGYEHALVAVDLLRRRGVPCRYRIVGRGRYEDAVAFARYQLDLEDCVEILTLSRPEELREQLDWADAYLNASVIASSPKHLIDAQARGVPVVTTEEPPAGPESALVVPAYDPKALADALGLLATDTALRARVTREGQEGAVAPRALPEQLDRFCELYDAVRSGAVS